MTDVVRRRVWVRGDVQGVYFRGATQDEATRHGVGGWVRNRGDGSVEAVFEGSPSGVDALLAFVREGPRYARVREVRVSEEPPEGEARFRILT